MAEFIKVSIKEGRFVIHGGEPRGRDSVQAAILRWPGWSRSPAPAELGGRQVSVYSAPSSPVSAACLANTAMAVHWEDDAQRAVEKHLEDLRLVRAALDSPKPTNAGALLRTGERTPMRHQVQALEAMQRFSGRWLLADDMGLGKSSSALWAANELATDRILVVCPASVKFNWQKEVRKTLGWPCYVIDGTPKQRANIFADAIATRGADKQLVVVINYDLLITLNDLHTGMLAGLVHGQALICDESHYLKSRKSQRTKFVMEFFAPAKGGARVRLLLAGTPIRNLVDDLWSQVQICRPGTWNGYWDFAKRHLVMRPMDFGGKRKVQNHIVGTKDIKGLNAVMNTLQIRRKKEDVLNLPPKIHTYPELTLTGDLLTVYKAMKQLAVLALEELADADTIWSPQARGAVLQALRCEQIAQGFCGGVPEPLVEKLGKILSRRAKPIPGRPREIIFPDAPKLVWLMEAIETVWGQDGKVVVFSRFNAPLHWLYEHYSGKHKRVGFLHGAITSKQKGNVVEAFQDGKFDLLLCQIKMAEGWNAHIAQDALFLGRDWAPAINHQAEDRLHRIGQKGTVNIQIPIVRNTIERMIHNKLAAKDADAAQALKTVTIKELREAL